MFIISETNIWHQNVNLIWKGQQKIKQNPWTLLSSEIYYSNCYKQSSVWVKASNSANYFIFRNTAKS